jgi:hypothetical protein
MDASSDRGSELNALDELFKNSSSYKTSTNYIELLRFITRFPLLSPFNAFMVHLQNKGVQLVLTARKWKDYNRTVKFNARPLVILVPFGPINLVYDIADTEGEPVPDALIHPFSTAGNLDPGIFYRTLHSLYKEGIHYEEYPMHKGAAGYATTIQNDKFNIVGNSSYSINEKYSALVHEIAHIFCGHLGNINKYKFEERRGLPHDQLEIEAESVSYIVCKRVGLEPSSNRYLSNYIKGSEVQLPFISLEKILTVANMIEQMGKPGYRSKLLDNSEN